MTSGFCRRVTPGQPWPLGVTLAADGVNVAVWAPDADEVFLCLFGSANGPAPEERILLPYRDGEIRHAHVSGVRAGDRYGLRAAGPDRPEENLRFDVEKLLVDPATRAIEEPLRWHPRMAAGAGDTASIVPKCVVVDEACAVAGPDPSSNRPDHPFAELVILETHVRGLTAAHPDVPEDLRGTYAGMAHPAVIEHLSALGVTAVELLPVQASLDDQHVVERGLTNFWGYQPIAWAAPEPRYVSESGAGADAEFRHLVYSLHEAGIEVILDVVFNHTGEGDECGPTLSLRGLHERGAYRRGASATYLNDAGTGNTVDASQPMMLRLIMDCLRHWATRYGVDGFRFDLAVTLGRAGGDDEFDPAAAFFQAIAQDPALAGRKFIAEPWDLGPGGYRLGAFPHPWAEWNDRFRDGVRRLWRGDGFGDAGIGSLLLGSAAHFDHSGRPATASINFVTAHDGFTLADVVSYSRKHNEANGEENRDGRDENFSDNLGVEGPSNDPGIVTARARRARAMLATLLVAQGVPMLLAGDEIGNSQSGNNNAYAQDNEIGWVDWSAPDMELFSLVRHLIAARRRVPVLRQTAFLHGRERGDGHRDIVWRRADAAEASDADWNDAECLVAELRGAAGGPEGEQLQGAALVILNTGGDADVSLPDPGAGQWWEIEVDTARPEARSNRPTVSPINVLAQSVTVLSSSPKPDDGYARAIPADLHRATDADKEPISRA